jgi:hypothetical protein
MIKIIVKVLESEYMEKDICGSKKFSEPKR